MEHGFQWYQLIPGFKNLPPEVFGSLLVFFILSSMAFLFHLKFKKRTAPLIPDAQLTLFSFFDVLVEKLLSLVASIMGHGGKKYFPLMATLFIFILFCNLLGLIPGFLPPTNNLNTNLACALSVFIYYNIQGLKTHGLGYLKHFLGPVMWLAPIMVIIELISHVVRPASLSIRLFGNISGDHMVLNIFSGLAPVGVPVIFMFLGLFVSVIQAFVFTLLSMVYLSLAVAEDH
ncbi:MAG: F0F1 ATP synthase subunit A [Deltaproteobacteria bacterium]|nr:F0F1 ATP synthase subunit A [Deltaproteobacteria bacterium]